MIDWYDLIFILALVEIQIILIVGYLFAIINKE